MLVIVGPVNIQEPHGVDTTPLGLEHDAVPNRVDHDDLPLLRVAAL